MSAELSVLGAETNAEYSLEPGDIYQADDSDKRRITFRLTAQHHQKTLKTTEVNAVLDTIAGATNEKFAAVRL